MSFQAPRVVDARLAKAKRKEQSSRDMPDVQPLWKGQMCAGTEPRSRPLMRQNLVGHAQHPVIGLQKTVRSERPILLCMRLSQQGDKIASSRVL